MFDYSRKLLPHEVRVSFTAVGYDCFPTDLVVALEVYGNQYGFTFDCINIDCVLEYPVPYVLNHLICLSTQPYDPILVERCAKLLDMYNTISLGFTYPDATSMLAARPAIEKDKKVFKDRINFLRPDISTDGIWHISHQKILDNAVCDSVRVKFSAIKILNRVGTDAIEHVEPFLLAASNVYQKFSLFHRSATDGYFAMRLGDSFVITATKTNKVELDMDRVCLVYKYDEIKNTIYYAGNFLPSSDSVEAAIIFRELPSISTLIHTHASDRFTRNPNFATLLKVPPLPYGETALGYSLVQSLKESRDGFVIMEEHGEVFADSSSDWNTSVENIATICKAENVKK
jgi:hypothetical protein